VLSLSEHERLSDAPFDRLRVNGDRLGEEHRNLRKLLEEYVYWLGNDFFPSKETEPSYFGGTHYPPHFLAGLIFS
jgi:hypothetical protein